METVTQITDHDSDNQLRLLFHKQKQAFRSHPWPTLDERKEKLKALKKAMLDNKLRLAQAVSEDFGYRPVDETMLLEMMTTIGDINYTLSNLRKWMKPESRHVALQFLPASNTVVYQPLGVVGIIVPWNYPLYLSVGPLITAIAAGNRAMMKMSEYTPAFNKVLKDVLASVFDESEVCLVEGEADVAARFSTIPFDHLLFTGSTNVGKMVMKAAAENLTPVTLELGGKSPTIIAPDISISTAVQRLLFGKCANAGQTCVAPDYVLCPEDKLDEFKEEVIKQFNDMYPDFNNCEDYTYVVNDRQYGRLMSWLEEAEHAGATVVSTTTDDYTGYNKVRKLPLQMVFNAPDDIQLMQQELFGPVLPVVGYKDIQDAVDYIQDRPRPLALYVLSFDKKTQETFIQQTHAGGVGINDTIVHVGQEDLPFGGVGPSGLGHYHGKEGFLTFSKAKGVHKKGRIFSTQFITPPYHKSLLKLVLKFFMR